MNEDRLKKEIALSTALSEEVLSSADVLSLFQQYVIPNYTRYPVALTHGEGSYVWDAEGNRYLDLFPGWGCGLLGHCPAPVVEAVRDQLGTLIHVPNAWHTEVQGRWAEALSQRSFGGQAFFCNSGTEANEAAIKLVRLHGMKSRRYKVITFEGSFHGRTLGSLTATAQPKYHEGLGPLMAGFVYAPFGDLDAVARLIDNETAAIMIEPIQGEGGVRIPPDGLLGRASQAGGRAWPAAGIRRSAKRFRPHRSLVRVPGCRCDARYYDSLQSPLRRDRRGGNAGEDPDVRTRAGMHAATFGGNPIAARAGLAAIEMIESQNLLEAARHLGDVFQQRLGELQGQCDLVREVRVRGAMIGIELAVDGTATVRACMERRLLINCTHGTVVRLLPAFTLSDDQAHEGCDILAEVIKEQAGSTK